MNMKTSTSAFSAFILALLAGCLTTTPPPQSDWNIECSERAACLAETPKFGVAKLALVEVRAPYSVREVAVLRADGSMAFDQFNKGISNDGYSSQVQLRMTVNVRFTNNSNHAEDFEQKFSATSTYDAKQQLVTVQEDLVNEMCKDITDQIFNKTVANW